MSSKSTAHISIRPSEADGRRLRRTTWLFATKAGFKLSITSIATRSGQTCLKRCRFRRERGALVLPIGWTCDSTSAGAPGWPFRFAKRARLGGHRSALDFKHNHGGHEGHEGTQSDLDNVAKSCCKWLKREEDLVPH